MNGPLQRQQDACGGICLNLAEFNLHYLSILLSNVARRRYVDQESTCYVVTQDAACE